MNSLGASEFADPCLAAARTLLLLIVRPVLSVRLSGQLRTLVADVVVVDFLIGYETSSFTVVTMMSLPPDPL